MKNVSRQTSPKVTVLLQDAPQHARPLDEDPDRHLIRLQLAKPPHERTHFLRIPLANGGSCI
jgi:hypothetical protein